MIQECYSNIIGKQVWEKCKDVKIWISDYEARIEFDSNHFCDRLDIIYDKFLGNGEIKYVDVVEYGDGEEWSEDRVTLSSLPLNEQKDIFELFEKEFPKFR